MKNNKYLKIYVCLIEVIIFFSLFTINAKAESIQRKNVLIISSYGNEVYISSGYKSNQWIDEIISTINQQLIESKENINLKMEYMSSGEKSWLQYYNLYKNNFSGTKFDVIVTLDDNAFSFLVKYGNELFPDTPVIFSGVNNFNESILNDHSLFTGLVKSEDVEKTIDIALELHQNTKQVLVVADNATRIDYEKIIEGLKIFYNNRINFIFSKENNITNLQTIISELSDNTLIYLDAQLKDDEGIKISEKEVIDTFFNQCNKPIYSKSIKQLENGSVGGMITNGTKLGTEVGKLVLRVLNGEKPYKIPVVVDSSHNYVFNYDKLQQFNIDIKALPKGAEIIGMPENTYEIPKEIIIASVIILLMIFCLGLIFIKFHIRKRKLAERLLGNSKSVISTLINSTPNIVYFKNPDNTFIEINSTALNIFNINTNEYKNIIESSYIPINKNNLFREWEIKDKEVWEKGTICRSEEVIFYEKENCNKIYDILRIPLFNDDGTAQGLIFLGIDITDHKIKEENQQRIKELLYYDELRTNFFSNISHELKTPLNLIFSALQVIELKINISNNDEKSISKYTSTMRQNCYRLLRIIDNLIDITKIDAGHFFTDYSNKDIVSVIENIVLSIVEYVESKGISITFDTDIEEQVMAFDPDAIERIILNLLSNAIKFTPNGGNIEVSISKRGNNMVISVKDSGVGIPLEKQTSVFEKFVQVDKSLSRNREGSGIGLSLVKELVTLHEGTIKLESDLGKGSEFIIELPIRVVDEDKNSHQLDSYKDKVERIMIEFSDIYN